MLIIYENGLNNFMNTNTKCLGINTQKFEKIFNRSFETALRNMRKMPDSLVLICFSAKEKV